MSLTIVKDQKSLPPLEKGWVTKENFKSRIVSQNGRDYQVIAKREKKISCNTVFINHSLFILKKIGSSLTLCQQPEIDLCKTKQVVRYAVPFNKKKPVEVKVDENPKSSKFKSTKNFFYKDSILHGLNSKKIKAEIKENSQKSLIKRVITPLVNTPAFYLKTFIVTESLEAVTSQIFNNDSPTMAFNPTYRQLVIGSLKEEIFYRGILQNAVFLAQKAIPKDLAQNSPIFKWLSSPSMRILTVGALFAAVHYMNAGGYATSSEAAVQVAATLLFQRFSIMYETSGNLLVPMTAHVAHNVGWAFFEKTFL